MTESFFERRAEIRALLDAATSGPWNTGPETAAGRVWVYAKWRPLCEPQEWFQKMFTIRGQQDWIPGETRDAKDARLWKQKQQDAAFIAASPENMRYLLDALDVMTAERDALSEPCPCCGGYGQMDPGSADGCGPCGSTGRQPKGKEAAEAGIVRLREALIEMAIRDRICVPGGPVEGFQCHLCRARQDNHVDFRHKDSCILAEGAR